MHLLKVFLISHLSEFRFTNPNFIVVFTQILSLGELLIILMVLCKGLVVKILRVNFNLFNCGVTDSMLLAEL